MQECIFIHYKGVHNKQLWETVPEILYLSCKQASVLMAVLHVILHNPYPGQWLCGSVIGSNWSQIVFEVCVFASSIWLTKPLAQKLLLQVCCLEKWLENPSSL